MMKLFVFACLVAFAAASALTTYTAPIASTFAAPYSYGAYPYAGYGYGAYPYSSNFYGNYKPLAYSSAYSGSYASPLTYTNSYKPLAYSGYTGYNGYYGSGAGYPYLY